MACFPAIVKNDVFVAKICKYALSESSEGFCCGPRKPANPCHPGAFHPRLSSATYPAGYNVLPVEDVFIWYSSHWYDYTKFFPQLPTQPVTMSSLWRMLWTQCKSLFRWLIPWYPSPNAFYSWFLGWYPVVLNHMHHNILFLQMALYSIVDMDERDQMLTTNCIFLTNLGFHNDIMFWL